MTVDWRLSKLQREAQAKREQLDHHNRTIEGLGAMLEEARAFEGYFNDRLAVAERRVSEVSTQYGSDLAGPFVVQRGDDAERERRIGEREAILRERDEEMARRTTTTQNGPDRLTFCAVKPADIIKRRAYLIGRRDHVARELAEIEAQMTPGHLVQSGVPAADYLAHRGRVATLRERLDTKA